MIKGFKRKDYVEAFLNYLGEEGTLVALSYTNLKFSLFGFSSLPVYSVDAPAYTGAFSNIMLKNRGMSRSLHPSNSIVSIGKQSKYITQGLENKLSFEYVRRLIELDAKVLLVGCDDYPGFVTHFAEQELKLYKQYWFGGFFRCVDSSGKVFKKIDPSGCSKTFSKLYPIYQKYNKITSGRINTADSLFIRAKDAFEIDLEVLRSNKKFLECSSKTCFKCRAGKFPNIINLPVFAFYYLKNKFF